MLAAGARAATAMSPRNKTEMSQGAAGGLAAGPTNCPEFSHNNVAFPHSNSASTKNPISSLARTWQSFACLLTGLVGCSAYTAASDKAIHLPYTA